MKEREGSVTAAIVLLGMLLIAMAGCWPQREKQIPASTESQMRKEAAPTPAQKAGEAKPATAFVANPFCNACHADFDEERLVATHKAAGIGCERCHGESLRHRSDEANVTPPELMYPKERINPTCMMCHPRQTIRQVESHRPILEAGLSIFDAPSPDENAKKYCTDCHGRDHQMNTRTIRWDKCTGKLLK
jgi:hypothetical protein